MGAKEGQEWAPGAAIVGWSERTFGDKVDLNLLWKDCISPLMLHCFFSQRPPDLKCISQRLTTNAESGGSRVIYAILFLIHLVH